MAKKKQRHPRRIKQRKPPRTPSRSRAAAVQSLPSAPLPVTASVADQAEIERVRAALERRRAGQSLSKSDIKTIRDYEDKRAIETWWARARRLPQHELLSLLGVKEEQIKRWRSAGLPAEYEGRNVYYELPAVIAWLRRYWQGGIEGDGVETSKRAAEIKLLIRREAALQLKMQILSGELVHRDDVERGRCERIKMVRSGLEALKRSLAPAVLELGEETTLDQAESLIWDYVEPLLKAFSGQRSAVSRRKKDAETRRHGDGMVESRKLELRAEN